MTGPVENAAQQRAHWDAVLDVDNVGPQASSAQRLLLEARFARTPDTAPLWNAVSARENPLVLDLGGGLGTYAIALARAGHRVVVADVSGERLGVLRLALHELDLLHRVSLVQTAAEQIAIRSRCVDVVWTRSVLIHTDLQQALDEIIRCLTPEGEAVLCEPLDGNPLVNLYRRLVAPKAWTHLAQFFNPRRVNQVVGALRDGGVEPFYIASFLAFFWQFSVRAPGLFRLTLGILWPLDRLLMRVWPHSRRLAWFAVMTGKAPRS